MIVDASALVAIVRKEPEGPAFTAAIAKARQPRLSAPTFLEVAIVTAARTSAVKPSDLDRLVQTFGITIEPFTEAHARLAREAYRRFGKGSGHPAQLNFGDCMAYALARHFDEPLLFKGNDFRRTGIRQALP